MPQIIKVDSRGDYAMELVIVNLIVLTPKALLYLQIMNYVVTGINYLISVHVNLIIIIAYLTSVIVVIITNDLIFLMVGIVLPVTAPLMKGNSPVFQVMTMTEVKAESVKMDSTIVDTDIEEKELLMTVSLLTINADLLINIDFGSNLYLLTVTVLYFPKKIFRNHNLLGIKG